MFETLFDERGRDMWREEVSDEVRLLLASPQVTGMGEKQEFHHPSPELDVEEEEAM